MSLFDQLVEYLKAETYLHLLEHLILAIVLVNLIQKMRQSGGILKSIAKFIIRTLRSSSTAVSKKIAQEIGAEAAKTVQQEFSSKPSPVYTQLPQTGIAQDKLLSIMKDRSKDDLDPTKGKAWAYVYDHSHQHTEFVTKAHNLFIHTNSLNPMKFVSLRNFELEIIAMTARMMNGNPQDCVGSVTSGGSESLLLAVKTYRDRLLHLNPSIVTPELIMCVSGHPAINKACHYFGVKAVFVGIEEDTLKMKFDEITSKINANTCCIIASAPSYPHGVLDDIEAISNIAQKHQIPLHIDSAIGGFVLPFIEKTGRKLPPFDFRLPGVSSISADVHKYGFSAKGASVLVYRNSSLRIHQFYSYTSWSGGIYISPTMLGTKGGGPLAGAWASMMSLGESGYVEITKKVLDAVDELREGITSIPELSILGNPISTTIAFVAKPSSKINIHHVADAMKELNDWQVENQRFPDCIHISVMPQHLAIKKQFIIDLKQAVQIVKENPKKYEKNGTAAMYGMMGMVPDDDLLEEFLANFMDNVYKLPAPTASS